MRVNPHENETNGHSLGKAGSDISVRLLGHSDTGKGFLASSSAFPCQYKSINAPCSRFIHLSQTLYNNRQHHSIKVEQISAFVGGFNLPQQRTYFLGY